MERNAPVPPPELRAAMVQDFLALLERTPAPEARVALQSLPPHYVDHVRALSRVAWIPAEPVAALADRGREVLGERGWRALHKGAATDLLERPLFKALITGAYSIFGASPSTIVRSFPKVFDLSHRHFGTLTAAVDTRTSARIELRDAAPAVLTQGFIDVFAATLEGAIAPLCVHGEVHGAIDLRARSATITAVWR